MLERFRDGSASVVLIVVVGSFAVFASALAFLSTVAYDRATQDYQTSRAYDETKREFERRCRGLEGDEIFDCLKEQIEAAREPGRSEEDVQAQKEMARWAWWLLIVSGITGFASIAVGFYGVVLVRNTLKVNRDAVDAAIAANAQSKIIADESLSHQKNVSNIELRPWIDISVEITDASITNDGLNLIVTAKTTNIGKTPAYNVYAMFSHHNFPVEDENARHHILTIDHGAAAFFGTSPPDSAARETILPGGYTYFQQRPSIIPRGAWVRHTLPGGRQIITPGLLVHCTYEWLGGQKGQTSRRFFVTVMNPGTKSAFVKLDGPFPYPVDVVAIPAAQDKIV